MSDQEDHSKATETELPVAVAKDEEEANSPEPVKSASPVRSQTSEQGEIKEDEANSADPSQEELLKSYPWCKCSCDPAAYNGVDHYFLNMHTHETQWQEPSEKYWIWDAMAQAVDPRGLQEPTIQAAPAETGEEADPDYYGYNPKIHGSYDPNAPYAKYHKQKREQEAYADHPAVAATAVTTETYAAAGTFNRFTGSYQIAEQSSDRHNDYNKSGRQMAAFFDMDAAANSHDGRSLKEERRNQHLSKKQVKEMMEKRRAKKERKRLEFYKS